MSVDRGHLGRYCYICQEDESRECTNLVHARLYSTIAHRGDEADLDSFLSMSGSDTEVMIEEMGFVECQSLCVRGKANGCFYRSRQTVIGG